MAVAIARYSPLLTMCVHEPRGALNQQTVYYSIGVQLLRRSEDGNWDRRGTVCDIGVSALLP